MEFFATCPRGFEHLLQDELKACGIRSARALQGQASFEGGLEDAYRACMWSRLASRVVLVLARGGARNADELYATVASIDWSAHMAPGRTFAIDAHGTNQELRNTQFVALRAKDAITDQLLARTGTRPQTDARRPDVEVQVRVTRDRATVGINLSGAPLFRRGYEGARNARTPLPPLRPDYAAALLAAGGWFRLCREAARAGEAPTLIAENAGAGTVLVEAAEQALDRAPGLTRARWGFEGWAGHDADAWQKVADEAHARADGASRRGCRLLAIESRAGARQAATQMLRAAGMPQAEAAFIEPGELAGTLAAERDAAPCAPAPLMACDLSWLERDAVAQEAAALRDLGACAQALGQAGTISILSASPLAEDAIGAAGGPASSLATTVGKDAMDIRTYDAATLEQDRPAITVADASGAERQVPVWVDASAQFASRLRKVWRERRKWARREDVSCFRIYDADLPDYAVSIDLFEGSELLGRHDGKRGRWLQIYEYQAPREVDAALARKRLLDVLALAPLIIGVTPENVFVRTRSRARGGSQYASDAKADALRTRAPRDHRGSQGNFAPLPPGAHLVDEGGLTFEVNFSARLDCGLFLDHRETRALVREMMKPAKGSKRFLNLFAYTGTATCYAADGGARHTTTVDMSAPSLAWARRNMIRNGFDGPAAEYVKADVIDWVQEQRHTRNRWDLVFCDVPTFSNSKGMRHGSWDVQRDHAELLIAVSRLLTREGVCIFSCNLRSFKPDVEALAKADVSIEDITAKTIPEDFKRNPKIHHCYLVRHVPQARTA